MALAAEKPSMLERLGSALNSSNLSPVEGRIGSVELVAALAYTQLNPDASVHAEQDLAHIDPRTELAAVLIRLKYAGDRVLGDRAVLLLSRWVRHQKAFGRWRNAGRVGLVEMFVRQSLAEWLYPVCQVCHGREMLGLERGETIERRIRCTRCRGSGWLTETSKHSGRAMAQDCRRCGGKGSRTVQRQHQGKPRTCYACRGTGRHRPNDAERVCALGIEPRTYQRHWVKRFAWLEAGLDRLDYLIKLSLQCQMKLV